MGKGFKHGAGGNPLNFKVVPGLTQPGTAAENTIWVKTEKIGAWYFSATQPEGMQDWDVWFPTGTESAAKFNALRKNAVQVYPLSAKQYVDGALVARTAQSYQNGEWVEWLVTYLFMDGTLNSYVTGWVDNYIATPSTKGTVSIESDCIKFTSGIRSGGWGTGSHFPLPAIDMTNYKTVKFDIKFDAHMAPESEPTSAAQGNGVGIASDIRFEKIVVKHTASKATRQTVALDVSALTGMYYCCLFVCGTGSGKGNTGYCYEISFD